MADLAERIFAATARVRGTASGCLTNFFAERDELLSWIERGGVSYEESTGALLVLRRDRDFQHLYHIAGSSGELSTALSALLEKRTDQRIVADLVGPPADLEVVTRVYGDNGFREHTSLIRMMRMGESPPLNGGNPALFAEESDVPAVQAFVDRMLDRFRDQIPDALELKAAAARRNLLIERSSDRLVGFLLFANTGITSVLRYWYVDPKYVGQGIGGRLMHTYLRNSATTRRFILWVVSDNGDSIAKYEHYGYRREKLMDRIMIYEGDYLT